MLIVVITNPYGTSQLVPIIWSFTYEQPALPQLKPKKKNLEMK